MVFAEKLRKCRSERNVSQKVAATEMGLPFRTYQQYESGNTYPRRAETYTLLANYYGVPIDYLISTEDEIQFEPEPTSLNGLIAQVGALFAGGQYSDSDKDKVMQAITELYWDSKNQK